MRHRWIAVVLTAFAASSGCTSGSPVTEQRATAEREIKAVASRLRVPSRDVGKVEFDICGDTPTFMGFHAVLHTDADQLDEARIRGLLGRAWAESGGAGVGPRGEEQWTSWTDGQPFAVGSRRVTIQRLVNVPEPIILVTVRTADECMLVPEDEV